MTNFAQLRQTMVDNQLRTNDVTSYSVLDRFGAVPREIFVPNHKATLAYSDSDVAVWSNEAGEQRYLMEAFPFARLVQAAKIKRSDLVLDVACGTGYSTAVLAGFCESVVAVESQAELVDQASANLVELGIDNAAIVQGALEDGYAKEGPYDVIVMNGAVEELPKGLFDQLREGGRLLAFVGFGHAGILACYTKTAGHVSPSTIMNASVPALPGFERPVEFAF